MNGASEFVIMHLLPPFIAESNPRFLCVRHTKELKLC